MPIFLYQDDFEVNDPIGGHTGTQTISAFYYNFPCVDFHNYAKIDSIFPATFLKSANIKKFGYEKCIYKLVKVLAMLETDGIIINTNKGPMHFYFVLGLVIGDNLALNTLLGFSISFSHNYYCRFCFNNKSSMHTISTEDDLTSRNIVNYEEHLHLNNYAATGIYEKSLLNSLGSFHVTVNFSVDIMHNLLEGVIKYGLLHALNYFITNDYFSLDTFNYEILIMENWKIGTDVNRLRHNT